MNKKITRFALAAKWGGLGLRGFSNSAAASFDSSARMDAKPSIPNPQAD
jgi:hypothetical protein